MGRRSVGVRKALILKEKEVALMGRLPFFVGFGRGEILRDAESNLFTSVLLF